MLLLGPDGQVGWELQRALVPLGDVVAVRRSQSGDHRGDLADLAGLERLVRTIRPDVIVNAAAYTAVDRAESEPDMARVVNAEAPAVLGREARRIGVWLVHYSTDYVFDGRGDRAWTETDPTGPLNVYGATKLAGENAIRDSGCRHLILRTSWVYAAHGNNFILKILRRAQERDVLQVVNDQVGAPTGAELIADITAHLLSAVRWNPEDGGTYHLAASGETTWYGFACFVIERARTHGGNGRLTATSIEAVPTEAIETRARRPRNSRLSCEALTRTFGLYLPDWRVGVDRVLAKMYGQETEAHDQ